MGTGERIEEITFFLKWVRDELGLNPGFVTMDFDDSWEIGVKIVFPDAKIIICTFHAIQLLTRGLIKEFNRLQRERNNIFINECKIARRRALANERGKKDTNPAPLTSEFCRIWLDFAFAFDALIRVQDPDSFTKSLDGLLGRMRAWNQDVASKFSEKIDSKKPKKGFTKRSLQYSATKFGKMWRSVLTTIRKEREEKKKEFSRIKYLLLKKPRNLAEWEKSDLKSFLKENPWARPYRETIRRFYNLLEKPPKSTPSLDFLDKILQDDSHDWLKSAINTLKTRREQVFNFVKALKIHPEWEDSRSFKVNPEPIMRRVNDLARGQYGFRSDEMAAFKIEQFLNCPVILSSEVLADQG